MDKAFETITVETTCVPKCARKLTAHSIEDAGVSIQHLPPLRFLLRGEIEKQMIEKFLRIGDWHLLDAASGPAHPDS